MPQYWGIRSGSSSRKGDSDFAHARIQAKKWKGGKWSRNAGLCGKKTTRSGRTRGHQWRRRMCRRYKLYDLHLEARTWGRGQEGADKSLALKSDKYWHQTQNLPALSIIIVFIITITMQKLLFARLFPPKYLKCCCNTKYHLWHICPGSKECDLEYLIGMCYRR